MIKKTLFSILDQLAVSGGNFLTVILAAHFCKSEEMGKLAYLFTLYILTILINTSAIFYYCSLTEYTSYGVYCNFFSKIKLVS